MKIKNIMIATIAILTIGSITIISCNKEAVSHGGNSDIETKAVKPMSPLMKAFLLKNGISVKAGVTYIVTYRQGCYEMVRVLWGAYESVKCKQGCDYCELIGVKENGVSIKLAEAIKPDKNTGRYGLDIYPATEDMHDGLMYIRDFEEEPRLYFLVDINKVSKPQIYAGDSLHLESPFSINYELAINAKISGKDQIVPAGTYKLEKFDDIVVWSIPLGKLLSDEEQKYYQKLIANDTNEAE